MTQPSAPRSAPAAEGIAGVPASEFTRLLAHEIRNHLAPIQNALHVLRLRARDDGTLTSLIELMERQVKGMVQTLDTLGEAARASAGELVLNRSPLALAEIVSSAVGSVSREASERGQRIDVVLSETHLQVDGDGPKLQKAVSLLLENAVRHGRSGGPISIRVERDAGGLVLDVADEGPGLPAALVPHAFDFLTARDHQGLGPGIGLPLAQRIVAAHHGSLEILPRADRSGTLVRMRLPPIAPSVPPAQEAVPPYAPAGGAKVLRWRILLAEDSPAVRASLADLLTDMGHEVATASDGLEAVERAHSWRPDYVLVDLHMPKLNGFDVARRLRADFPSSAMQLVMLSGSDLDAVMVQGAKLAGFDHWIDKGRVSEGLAALLAPPPDPGA